MVKLYVFLQECKTSKLKALLKKGWNTDPKKHRPIWFLPILSKVNEKSILSVRRLL